MTYHPHIRNDEASPVKKPDYAPLFSWSNVMIGMCGSLVIFCTLALLTAGRTQHKAPGGGYYQTTPTSKAH